MKKRFSFTILLLGLMIFALGAQTLEKVVLINASSDATIRDVKISGDTIDITAYPMINFRAVTNPEPLGAGQCTFDLSGPGGSYSHAEGGAPYACFGDISGDYKDWANGFGSPPSFTEGVWTLKITPGSGTPVTYTFVLKSGNNPGGGETGSGEPIVIPNGGVKITGETMQWHNITLNIGGPTASETGTPNPFKDFRLQATFTQGDKRLTVPGYFDADGNAKETGASSGNIWKIHFCPPEIGTWNYTLSFRNGENVALTNAVDAGSTVAPLDGMTGSIEVLASNKTGRDFRSRGRLTYVGERYLRFAGTGEYFVKAGSDAPENFLAYNDFDNTPNIGGRRKTYAAHQAHWIEGDPTWQGTKGKSIIGAVNYLASKGANVFSFLTMNINGDDKNVYPYVTSSNHLQFDVSKMDQWAVVFDHAQKLGMFLHFKTQETENERLLDDGNTTLERKLYYRELIARYGHHLALNWNLGEENGASFNVGKKPLQNDAQRKAMAQYFFDNDPYKNHIVLHTAPGDYDKIYTPLIGNKSKLTGTSIQTGWSQVHAVTKTWVDKSKNAGKAWVIANDEQGPATWGVPPDAFVSGKDSKNNTVPNKHQIRYKVLWGNLLAGGGGVEYYFGYDHANSDLSAQDFTTREKSWEYCDHALDFFNTYIPFWEMEGNDNLTSKGYCFAKPGSVYVVYLQDGGSANVTLGAGTYNVKWYDPANGGALKDGNTGIAGGGSRSIGTAPAGGDMVALITEAGFTHNGNSGAPTDNGVVFPTDPVEIPKECGEAIILSAINDFPKFTDIPNFKNGYKDNAHQCLAIDASKYKGEFAAAQATWTGESGFYNIEISTLRELDGESTYRLNIGGKLIGEYKNKETDTDYAPSSYVWPNVAVSSGAQIQVEYSSHTNGKIAENGGTAFSRGRWTHLRFGKVCQTCDGAYLEQNGIVVMEPENVDLHKDWRKRPSTYLTDPTMAGSKGNGWIEWTGPESFSTTIEDGAANGVSILKFKIETEGVYTFKWRSKQYNAGQAGDQGNDTYVKFQTGTPQQMTGTKGNKYTIDKYTKVWIQSKNAWSWGTNFEPLHGEFVNSPQIYYTPGLHEIRLSGRSKGHAIDRIVLAHSSVSFNAAAFDAYKESAREGCVEVKPEVITATDVYLKYDTLKLFANETYMLKSVVLPENTSYPELKWTITGTGASITGNGQINATAAGEYTITATNDSSGLAGACHLIVLPDQKRSKLDKTKWTAIYADSEDSEKGGNLKENAIDGDLTTMWHTQWFSDKPALPHEIQIDLGAVKDVDFLDYWPRQDEWGPNGTIGDYEIYLSTTTTDWGKPIKKDYFRWAKNTTKEDYMEMRRVFFDKTYSGRYLRLVALSEAQNDPEVPTTSLAELDVWQYDTDNATKHISELGIAVYPNPFEEWITVTAKSEISSVEIFQLDGRKAHIKMMDQGHRISLQTSSLAPGVYVLKICSSNGTSVSHKVVKR